MPAPSMHLSKAAIALTVISLLCVFTEAATLLRVEDHRKTPEILDDAFSVANLQQNSTTQAQIFVQSLTTILDGFQQNFVFLYTTYIFDFYIKDQPLVNETIFMYNNTVTPDQSNQLWSDPQYGWSNPSTLLPWVTICMGYISSPLYNPSSSPEYSILKNHFSLTDDQMFALIGTSPLGTVDFQSSILVLLTMAVLDVTASENDCINIMGCSYTELTLIQFFQGSITKNPPFEGISGFDSVANVNQTYPAAPEILAVNTGDVYFIPMLAAQLLTPPAFGYQGGALFNVQDVQEIIDNQNNPNAIVNSLDLDNTLQAQVLINYVNYVLNQFAYQDQPNQAMTQNRANIITYNMNALMSDIANLTSINITAMGTSYSMQQQGKTCENILQDADISPSVITNICTNPEFTLDTAEGQAPWIAAYYAGEGSDMYALIENVTGISDWDLQNLLQITSEFGGIIDMVITAIADSLGCTNVPCDNGFLSTLQWAEAGVTRNLPRQYFNQTYSSLADVFPDHFDGSYPEFPAFTSKYLGVMVNLSLDQAAALLSYNVGSLNNPYEVFRFLTMNSDNDYADIQARFGLSKSLSNDMILYFDSGLPNYQ